MISRSISSSKKGQTGVQIIFIVLALSALAFSALFTTFLMGVANSEVQADTSFGGEGADVMQDLTDRQPTWLDGLFLMALMIFWVMLIITTLFIDSHPIFFILSIILIVVTIVVAGYIANAWDDLAKDADFSSSADMLPKINYVMTHLLEFIMGMVVTVVISLYGKSRLGL